MRTTVNIPDDVLTAAKVRAAETGVPLGAVVEAALRAHLREDKMPVADLVFPTFGELGLRAGVSLDDKEQLREILDAPA